METLRYGGAVYRNKDLEFVFQNILNYLLDNRDQSEIPVLNGYSSPGKAQKFRFISFLEANIPRIFN